MTWQELLHQAWTVASNDGVTDLLVEEVKRLADQHLPHGGYAWSYQHLAETELYYLQLSQDPLLPPAVREYYRQALANIQSRRGQLERNRVVVPAGKLKTEDEIERAKHNFVSYLERSGVTVRRQGRQYRIGVCPFHGKWTEDGDFNVAVSPDGLFYCHSYGCSGNGIQWVCAYEGVSFPEAVTILLDQ